MFVFNRSAIAVLVPLALLVAVVLWSSRSVPARDAPAPRMPARCIREADRRVASAPTARGGPQAVAATLPSRCRDSSAMVGKSNSSVRSTSPG